MLHRLAFRKKFFLFLKKRSPPADEKSEEEEGDGELLPIDVTDEPMDAGSDTPTLSQCSQQRSVTAVSVCLATVT